MLLRAVLVFVFAVAGCRPALIRSVECDGPLAGGDTRGAPRELVELVREKVDANGVMGVALAVVEGDEATILTYGRKDEKTCDPITPSTRFRWLGLAKLPFALALADGPLSDEALTTPLGASDLVPELKVAAGGEARRARMTLAHLATNHAGLGGHFFAQNAICGETEDETIAERLALGGEQTVFFEPGTTSLYSPVGVAAAGLAFARAVADDENARYEDVIREHVFEPLAIDPKYRLSEARDGDLAVGHGGVQDDRDCAVNFPSWQLYGSIDDAVVLFHRLKTLEAEGHRKLFAAGAGPAFLPNATSGWFNERIELDDGTGLTLQLGHSAGYAASYVYVRRPGAEPVAATLLTNRWGFLDALNLLLEAVRIVTGFELQPFDHARSPDRWAAYEGAYRDPFGEGAGERIAEVVGADGALVLKLGGEELTLRPGLFPPMAEDPALLQMKARDVFSIDLSTIRQSGVLRFWREDNDPDGAVRAVSGPSVRLMQPLVRAD